MVAASSSPGSTIPDLVARNFGSKEAGDRYIAYQNSMDGHAIAWQICRWEDADALMALTTSEQWKDFKPLAEKLTGHFYPVIVVNGKDGVGLGYSYLTVGKGWAAVRDATGDSLRRDCGKANATHGRSRLGSPLDRLLGFVQKLDEPPGPRWGGSMSPARVERCPREAPVS